MDLQGFALLFLVYELLELLQELITAAPLPPPVEEVEHLIVDNQCPNDPPLQ